MLRSWFILLLLVPTLASADGELRWPAAPDEPRVELDEVWDLRDFELERSRWSKLVRVVAGSEKNAELNAPFDICVVGDDVFLTCQGLDALVRIRPKDKSFKLFRSESLPCSQPVALAQWGDRVLMTDSERGMVYLFDDGKLEPWAEAGLERPTGVAVDTELGRVYVVDTATHEIVVLDESGARVGGIGSREEGDEGFNFPTFVCLGGDGQLVLNDTMNYRIKSLSPSGGALGLAFGDEGRAPGDFARPKGVGVLPDGRIVVADALLDRIQVFGDDGRCETVVGASGSGRGQFWSPNGVEVSGDLVLVADTYNHRIQVLRVLGGEG